MVWIAGIALAVALAYPWLRGSWIMATVLSVGWLVLAGRDMRSDEPVYVLAVVALIWLPFATWRLLKRRPAPLPALGRAVVGVELKR